MRNTPKMDPRWCQYWLFYGPKPKCSENFLQSFHFQMIYLYSTSIEHFSATLSFRDLGSQS